MDNRRIVIIDDHPLCAAAVTALFENTPWNLDVETCGSLRDLAGIARGSDIALILLDLKLPDAIGMSGIQKVKAEFPDVPICVMSGQVDTGTVRQVLAQRVAGFLPKTLSYDDLIEAFARLLDGESIHPFERIEAQGNESVPLSPAERRIMHSLCLGLQNKQIAYDLGLSESTVKSHLARVFDKLRVTNRSQAILVYESLFDGQSIDGQGVDGKDAGTSPFTRGHAG